MTPGQNKPSFGQILAYLLGYIVLTSIFSLLLDYVLAIEQSERFPMSLLAACSSAAALWLVVGRLSPVLGNRTDQVLYIANAFANHAAILASGLAMASGNAALHAVASLLHLASLMLAMAIVRRIMDHNPPSGGSPGAC